MDVVHNLQTLSREELMRHATQLECKVLDFKQAETELRQAYNELETHSQERTADMEQLNQALACEVVERVQAENMLVEEQQLLNVLMDNIPDLIYFKDTASRFTRINWAHARMLGVNAPNDALGKSDADFQAPELANSFMTEEENIISFGQSLINREEFNPALDGTPRWFSSTKVPIKDADGNVTGIVGISRDITKSKQVEQEAHRLQDALDRMVNGAQIIGFDWRYIYLNNAASKQSLRTKDELLGHTMMEMYPGIDQTPLFDKMRCCMEQRIPQNFENTFTFPDKSIGYFDLSIQPVMDGIFILSKDVSERKKGEEALRQNEEKLQTIFNLLPVGVSLLNNEQQIIQINRALEKILNLSIDELLQGKYKSRKYIHSDGSPMQASEFPSNQAHIKQQPVLDVEMGVIQEDRTTIWTSVSATPLPGNQGVVTVTVDLTKRKLAEVALRESERHLRLLAQNSPDIIYIIDLTLQRASYLNRPEFLGYSQNEIVEPSSLLQALHPEDKERVLAHWQELMITPPLKDVGPVEYRLQDKQGQWQWIQSRERIFASTAEGRAAQILVTLTVITEQKQAHQRARELEHERQQVKILSDFVKNTSHDFRTPLTIISSSLYLLSKSTDPEKQKRYFGNAEKQISHLTELLERLQEMSRLDGAIIFVLQPLDVNSLIADLCNKLSFQAKEKAVTVRSYPGESKLVVLGNAEELSLALAELGKNALGYTPFQGTITIRTWQEANQGVIEVADTGIGISSADLPHIFERLYRVDESRALETGGTGLGLSMVKRIIDLHHGSIVVESVEGKGSVFRLFLPLST